jgi:hypothetical protein
MTQIPGMHMRARSRRVGLGGPETDSAVQLAYQALAAAASLCDPTACLVVASFQTTWNAAGGSLAVSGVYEATTAAAAAQVATALGGATPPPACTAPYANCTGAPLATPSVTPLAPAAASAPANYTAPILIGASVIGVGIVSWALYRRSR